MSLAVFAVTLALIIVIGLWVQSELNVRRKKKEEYTEQNYNFTFTEEQKGRIKRIIDRHYIPGWCDTCNHYMGCSNGTAFGPPCSNCNGGKNYIADSQTNESDNRMFEEIEKIINE